MDLEKIKNTYKWDPASGDYSKSFVSYEKRIKQKQHNKRFILTVVYIIILLISIIIIYNNVK
ncbi:MAG: hypothetical protein JSS91_06885 [Bacteroidetes bacterium]|nr:hypothetical protein [Bacteroidota bacterium]